jgi:hypothetical protein
MAMMLLFVIGTGITLFSGCDSVGSPDDTHRDTAMGDQITEDPSPDRETVPSTEGFGTESDVVETDEEKNPEASQAPSTEATASEPENPQEPATQEPEENDKPGTDPEDTTAEAETTSPESLDFEGYNAMSAEEQEAFFLSFDSPADFFEWYNAAKEKYQEENPGIEIGPDGVIPLP